MARVVEVLDWLEANRYLSQQRFVESRIHVRAARHGNLRIQQELAQHGLALDADAAQTLKASEFDRAREVWSRKFDAPAADAAGRARQARFLTGRGFSAETVRRVLRESARGLPGDETD
jgi:regulatory protein